MRRLYGQSMQATEGVEPDKVRGVARDKLWGTLGPEKVFGFFSKYTGKLLECFSRTFI